MAKAKDLVIVESPSKAKTIEKYLGPNYRVTASMGHLRDLPKNELGVNVKDGFQPKYIPVKEKKDLIEELTSTTQLRQITSDIRVDWEDPVVMRYNGQRTQRLTVSV